jgi:hypothetical protein
VSVVIQGSVLFTTFFKITFFPTYQKIAETMLENDMWLHLVSVHPKKE